MHHLPSRYIPCDGRLTSSAYFNPHSPQGERQSSSLLCVVLHYISIHAPRRGSDDHFFLHTRRKQNFNPRSPQGERPSACRSSWKPAIFQSTLPAGGATRPNILTLKRNKFQSTLPSGGATADGQPLCPLVYNFNPRSPQGERHETAAAFATFRKISIHAPRRGSDALPSSIALIASISIHAPRRGSDGEV